MSQYLRKMYCVAALSGAVLFHSAGSFRYVHAETEPPTPDYGLLARVDIDSKLMDRLDARQDAIDEHLRATDSRVNETSERVSNMQGMGTGMLGLLGALNIFGLITTAKANKQASKQTTAS